MPKKIPTNQVFWYLPKSDVTRLKHNARADVVVIGGGMAGLTAAQRFKEKGCSVIVIEKDFCGGGASGKSSGFITPDSAFSLSTLVSRFGEATGRQLWEFACGGVGRIKTNIKQYELSCDYQVQDCLIAANSAPKFESDTESEHKARQSFGYDSTLYTEETLGTVLGSEAYFGAVRYPNTFGISAFRYLQGLKEVLKGQDIAIYEETPALSIDDHVVKTPNAVINADHIVLCADRFIPDLGKLTQDIYHVQTFLMVSAPLTDKEISLLFPDTPLMVWDTDLIYSYYRLTGENRLLIGGSKVSVTYSRKPEHESRAIFDKLTSYVKSKFPQLNLRFQFMWPGLIGVSKDVMPIAGRDKDLKSLYYVGSAAGLPWAAALGEYAADALVDGRAELDEHFSPYRQFPIGHGIQTLIGTRLTFALSHLSRSTSP